MTFADRAALLAYRVRPLEPPTLVAAIAAAVAAGIATIPGGPAAGPDPWSTGDVTQPLTMVALGLALAVGFVAGRDVDAAESLLRSAPRPYRRALVLRVAGWAIVSATVVAALSVRAAGALEIAPEGLRGQALVHLLFAGAVTVVLSRLLGPVAGGGAALAAVAVTAGGAFLFDRFPVHVLAPAGSEDWTTTSGRLVLGAAVLLAIAYRQARP